LAGWLDLLLIFFIAVLLGALAGIILIVFRKKSGKTAIPFGPFIAVAYVLVLLLGDRIWDLYFTLF
ncbi:MAG: prepilin peptidase, partial [Firmicutes bacterium]|nr:prepilin peptidase [Bacillota bacterium]